MNLKYPLFLPNNGVHGAPQTLKDTTVPCWHILSPPITNSTPAMERSKNKEMMTWHLSLYLAIYISQIIRGTCSWTFGVRTQVDLLRRKYKVDKIGRQKTRSLFQGRTPLLYKSYLFFPFLLKPRFFTYIFCQLYILETTFSFSNLCDVKACIFVTHKLFHLDVLFDNLFYLPYKLKI